MDMLGWWRRLLLNQMCVWRLQLRAVLGLMLEHVWHVGHGGS